MPRVVMHADMDAFYASVEQRDRPELRGKPVIVGATSPRGVVTAASYEARVFGVRSAMPGFEARRLCPDGIYLRGEMRRYRRASKQIFEIFRRFTPVVQGLSLDEAFLDLTGSQRLLGPAAAVGERLRAAVREETGLPISVGIAPVKMIAKLASGAAKPDGLLEVTAEGMRDFLEPLPVGRLWGVGPVSAARLQSAGFHTVKDLAVAPPEHVEKVLGAWGLSIARLARGQETSEVEAYREAKSYSEENTFASDIEDRGILEAAIVTHAEAVARRLRADEVHARTVVLKLKLARRVRSGARGYPLLTRRTTLPAPTDDGETIAAAARGQLTRAALTEPVRLLGVGVTNVAARDEGQIQLFPPPEASARRSRLNRALDEIAGRFGTSAVVRGTQEHAERAGLSMQIKRGEADD